MTRTEAGSDHETGPGTDRTTGPDAPSSGLTSLARKGFLWQAVAFGAARLSVLAATVVLARYLGPSDYGFVTLAVVLVTTLTVISDAGVSQALIYLDASDRMVGSALVVALVSSTTLALLWMLAAPPLAAALGYEASGGMLVALGSVIVITSLGLVPDAMLRRQLQFSRRLPGELARGTGRGVVAIVLAVQGFGPWSLVLGEIVGATAYAVVASVMAARSHVKVGRATRRDARRLLRFGLPTSMNGALATVVLNVDYVVVASVLGTSAVGVYFAGFRIPELVVLSVFQVFSQVAYPMYTRVKGQPERLGRAYLLSLRLQASYGLAAGVTIAVTAGTIVPVLFGDQYAGSVAVMQAIALYVFFGSLAVGSVDVFKSVGKPHLAVGLGVFRLVVLVPLLFLATRWGVTGVAVMQAFAAFLFAVVTQGVVRRLLGLPLRAMLAALAPAVVIAIAAGLTGWLVDALIDATTVVSLVASIGSAVVAATVALLLTDRGLVKRVVRG